MENPFHFIRRSTRTIFINFSATPLRTAVPFAIDRVLIHCTLPLTPQRGRDAKEAENAAQENKGVVANVMERFSAMRKWDETEHPVCVWYPNPSTGQGYNNFRVLSLNRDFLNRYMGRTLVHNLAETYQLDLNRDWSQLQSEEGMEILRRSEGYSMRHARGKTQPDPSYVITIDNLLKMLAIQLRLRNGLPVIIMGETGCGKSSLIRQLCAVLRLPLRTLNIHGGMDANDIVRWMKRQIVEASFMDKDERIVVFLDEVNTCNCMGLFKEIVCDRSIQGEFLPENLKVICACNPYRLKSKKATEQEAMHGLAFDQYSSDEAGQNIGTGIRDPLKNLVYRVHPLPESMIDHVYDFGALPPETEAIYIREMLRRQLGIYLHEEKKAEKKSGDDAKRGQGQKTPEEARMERIREMLQRSSGAGGILEGMRIEGRVGSTWYGGKVAKKNPDGTFVIHFDDGDKLDDVPPDRVRRKQQGEKVDLESVFGRRGSDMGDPFGGGPGRGGPGRRGPGRGGPGRDGRGGPEGDGSGAPEVSEEEMKKVISDIENSQGDSTFGDFVEVFASLICTSQEYVRAAYDGERSVVSLRDVARCVKIFRWFGEFFARNIGAKAAVPWSVSDFFSVKEVCRDYIRRAMLMSMAYCYYARLGGDERKGYGVALQRKYLKLQEPIGYVTMGWYRVVRVPKYGPRCTWLDLNAQMFGSTVDKVMRSFVRHIELDPGVALNEALLENLFMIMISILNQIPIFVVGKPGTSKSLAMKLIMRNMNGEASDSVFFRSLPAVSLFSYQCSPLSTSQGIEQAFMKAHKYKQQSPDSIVIVLLDEVGLAEQSPHLPLKVLHKVLDEGGDYSLVGISNWALDPAKMNRAVHLFRAAPTVEDLSKTAQGMVRNVQLDGYLRSIARAYNAVYNGQTQQDFWGLREFYSIVRHINLRLTEGKGRAFDASVLVDAVQRNFGGKPEEMEGVLSTFFNEIGLSSASATTASVVSLVRDNIGSTVSRHLMLLTKNGAALRLLFGKALLTYGDTEIIFGSDFPSDKNDLQIMQNLQQVKLCMAQGRTVVLVNCEALYESLYDLLNQHYTEFGSKLYVRLAFGTSNRLCEIHPSFRAIVITEKIDAYNRLAPPLLNRFEKQVMERRDLLSEPQRAVLKLLVEFVNVFAAGEGRKAGKENLRACFCGFHNDLLASLIQSLPAEKSECKDARRTARECIERLLWTTTPESVCRVMDLQARNQAILSRFGVKVGDMYFQQQKHADLVTFSEQQLEAWGRDTDGDGGEASVGALAELFTNSPMGLDTGRLMKQKTSFKDVRTINLHELSSERDMKQAISEFFRDCKEGSVFLLQCDPQAASLRRIEHSKYIIEKARTQFIQTDKWKKMRAERKKRTERLAAMQKKRGSRLGAGGMGARGAAGPPGGDEKAPPSRPGAAPGAEVPTQDTTPGVHVVILLHLQRGDVKFLMDFSKVWRQAFIDDLDASGNTGLPDIESLLKTNLSMSSIASTLHLPSALMTIFRASLSRMTYKRPRGIIDVQRQIRTLIQILQGDSDFIAAVEESLRNVIAKSGAKLDVMAAASKNQVERSFQAALHRQIRDVLASAFALLLSHIDRNDGMALIQDTTVRQIWLHLYRKSISTVFQAQAKQISRNGKVQVASDGRGAPFACRFPFSFFLCDVIEGLRRIRSEKPMDLIQQQLGRLKLSHNLDGVLSEDLLKRYVYDLACMQCKASRTMTRQDQSALTWLVLKLKNQGRAPEKLAEIHTLFWGCESTIVTYVALVDAVPPSRSRVLQMAENAERAGGDMDTAVVFQVLATLLEERGNWSSLEDYGKWVRMYREVRPIAEGVVAATLEGKSGAGKALECKECLERLGFVYNFLRDVAIPLSIECKTVQGVLAATDNVQLCSSKAFRTVIKMFNTLRFKLIDSDKDFKCPLSLEEFKDPVRLEGDGRTYERSWIEKYLGEHDVSPMTGETLSSKTLTPNLDIKEQLNARATEGSLKNAALRFMEYYIFDLCFGDGGTRLTDKKLLTDFLKALSGLKIEKSSIDIVSSHAARVCLLSALYNIKNKVFQKTARDQIIKCLQFSIKKKKSLGNLFSVNFVSMHEQLISASGAAVDGDALVRSLRDDVAQSDMKLLNKTARLEEKDLKSLVKKPSAVLVTIARLRFLLRAFAMRLARPAAGDNTIEAAAAELERILGGEFSDCPMQPSLRLYLVKCIKHAIGDERDALRKVISSSIIGRAKWLEHWKSQDEGLVRFLSASRLPRTAPYAEHPYFTRIHAGVAAAMKPSATDFSDLEAAIKEETAKAEEAANAVHESSAAAVAGISGGEGQYPEVAPGRFVVRQIRWQWSERDDWNDFQPSVNLRLEISHQTDKKPFGFSAGENSFIVDVRSGKQISARTRFRRDIRRETDLRVCSRSGLAEHKQFDAAVAEAKQKYEEEKKKKSEEEKAKSGSDDGKDTSGDAKQARRPPDMGPIKGALLVACFQEAFLLKALAKVTQATADRARALQKYILTSPNLGFLSAQDRKLLAAFCWDCDDNIFIRLSPESSRERIAALTLTAHVTALAISSSSDTALLRFVRGVISKPEAAISGITSILCEFPREVTVQESAAQTNSDGGGDAKTSDDAKAFTRAVDGSRLVIVRGKLGIVDGIPCVTRVLPKSLAEKAGVQVNWRLVAVGGRRVATMHEANAAFSKSRAEGKDFAVEFIIPESKPLFFGERVLVAGSALNEAENEGEEVYYAESVVSSIGPAVDGKFEFEVKTQPGRDFPAQTLRLSYPPAPGSMMYRLPGYRAPSARAGDRVYVAFRDDMAAGQWGWYPGVVCESAGGGDPFGGGGGDADGGGARRDRFHIRFDDSEELESVPAKPDALRPGARVDSVGESGAWLNVPNDHKSAISARKAAVTAFQIMPSDSLGFTHDDRDSLLIEDVDLDSSAYRMGVRRGWRLLAVDGRMIDSKARLLRSAHTKKRPFVLTLVKPVDDEESVDSKAIQDAFPDAARPALRILVNSALLAGSVLSEGKEWSSACRQIQSDSNGAAFPSRGKKDSGGPAEGLLLAIEEDLSRAAGLIGRPVEDATLAVHQGLGALLGLDNEVPPRFQAEFKDIFVGLECWGRYKGRKKFYKGTISAIKGPDVYEITYYDGDKEDVTEAQLCRDLEMLEGDAGNIPDGPLYLKGEKPDEDESGRDPVDEIRRIRDPFGGGRPPWARRKGPKASELRAAVPSDKVAQVTAVGFPEDLARYALVKTDGNIQHAVTWLLEHDDFEIPDDSEEEEERPSRSEEPPPIKGSERPAAMSEYKRGARVVRGPTWKWGAQDGGKGNVGVLSGSPGIDGWLEVTWEGSGDANNYRVSEDRGWYDVVPEGKASSSAPARPKKQPKSSSSKADEKRRALAIAAELGYTVGARVVRGPTWKWDQQDGGDGKQGTIKEVYDDAGWIGVRWDAGGANSYRLNPDENVFDVKPLNAPKESKTRQKKKKSKKKKSSSRRTPSSRPDASPTGAAGAAAEEDPLPDIAQPATPKQSARKAAVPSKPKASVLRAGVPSGKVASVTEMGFSEDLARHALVTMRGDVQAATMWILENQDFEIPEDSEDDGPAEKETEAKAPAATESVKADKTVSEEPSAALEDASESASPDDAKATGGGAGTRPIDVDAGGSGGPADIFGAGGSASGGGASGGDLFGPSGSASGAASDPFGGGGGGSGGIFGGSGSGGGSGGDIFGGKPLFEGELIDEEAKRKADEAKRILEEAQHKADEAKRKAEEERRKAKRILEEARRKEAAEEKRKADEEKRKARDDRLSAFEREKKAYFDGLDTLSDAKTRAKWLKTVLIGPFKFALGLEGLKLRVESLRAKSQVKQNSEAELFLDQVNERVDIKALPKQERRRLAPSLWRYRPAFSLRHFASQLARAEAKTPQYTVLAEFFRRESELRVLHFLPNVLFLQATLVSQFSRSMDMKTARSTTIKAALETLAEPGPARRAFEAYANAWKIGWPRVERFVGTSAQPGDPIPEKYRFLVDDNTPLSRILPGPRGESRCALAFAEYLVRLQNQFLAVVARRLVATGQQLVQGSTRSRSISSKFVRTAHALNYDLNGKFVPFIEKQCVENTEDGRMVYNFDNAEQWLMDAYFVGKPSIESDYATVQYTDDEDTVNARLLSQKVRQEDLTSDQQEKILSEVKTGAAASKCLQVLDTCISLLQATSGGGGGQGTSVAEMLLSRYLRETLLMSEEKVRDLGSSTITHEVRLKHIASLWTTLRSLLVRDRFADVEQAYKEPIEAKEAKALRAKCAKLDLAALLPEMQEAIATNLGEAAMDPNKPVYDFVGNVELDGKFFKNVSWFTQDFPRDVKMRCIVEFYKLLEELLREREAGF